jgi:hypothetical protein
MKKKINTEAIRDELAGSVFFPSKTQELARQKEISDGTLVSRYRDTKHDTMVSSNPGTSIPLTEDEMIEAVRKAVRQIGKEPATQRLTLEEKQALAEIEYTYKRQGTKTSGNEIIRIATNYIVRDYRKNGAKSILAQVLHKLNS